jgi:hypothetical protein
LKKAKFLGCGSKENEEYSRDENKTSLLFKTSLFPRWYDLIKEKIGALRKFFAD